jgi:MoaA/NifB/PqqE/SkfB family radical SAM enzyme
MNIAAIVRTGFSSYASIDLAWCKSIFYYKAGEPLQPVWEKLVNSGAEYVLIADNVVSCNSRHVWLMQQVLAKHAGASGITIDTEGRPANNNRKLPWGIETVDTLPSWLSLVKLSHWQDASCNTPEFQLLSQCKGKELLKITGQQIDFNATMWAGDLIASSSSLLAEDYLYAIENDPSISVPAQFRIVVPGQRQNGAFNYHVAEHPTFSVLCPSIRPDFLKEAVDSVLNQTYPNWELWIGIDGPKETQRKKIEEVLSAYLNEPRIFIRYYEHMGTGPMRKMLSEMAGGDFILCMDDDDRLSPNAFERFAESIRQHPHIHILRGGTRLFGIMDAYLSPRTRYSINGIPNDLFEATQPCVISKYILNRLGGFEWDPDLKQAGEDSDLLLKADKAGVAITLIDEPLYERRLSTLNQTLDCTAEECMNHIHYMYKKHNPLDWSLGEIRMSGNGPMINMVTIHKNQSEHDTVVCATQFMNFQQVGSRENVVLDLEVTSLCNAVCTFCPRTHLERGARFIDLELVKRVALSLKAEANHPTVVLCGIGEPTLHPKLPEIIQMLSDAGANVCMTTNGSYLSVEKMDALVDAGLSEVNISLNAFTPETHADLMKLKNFNNISEIAGEMASSRAQRWPRLKMHVSFVLTKRNEHEVDSFVRKWRGSGVSKIWLHPLTNRAGQLAHDCEGANNNSIIDAYLDDDDVKVDLFPMDDSFSNLCHVARGVDFVSVDGEMLLCAQDYEAKHRFGNVRDESLDRLHHNKILKHLRGETASTCAGCSFCPKSFAGGKDQSYTIVQAGAY